MNDQKIPMTEIDPDLFEEAVESVEKHSQSEHGEHHEAESEEIHVDVEASEEAPDHDQKELYDRFVRLTADFENFRKRVQKEKADYIRFGSEGIVKELLPAIDNFERALMHAEEETSKKGSFAEGVQMIYSQLLSVFEQFGVKGKSSLGKEFDPLIHEAMNLMPSNEFAAQKVMEEHRKAFFLHDRLIRPALVTVSTGPGKTARLAEDDIETKEVIDE